MTLKSKVGLTNKLESNDTDTVFLVYTMGKVASRTVAKSISKLYKNDDLVEVLHLQDIGGYYRRKYDSNYFFFANRIVDKIRFYLSRKIREMYKNKLLNSIKSKDNVYVITLVREPIGRAISANFQALESAGRLTYFLKNEKFISYEKLKKSFYNDVDHNAINRWFDCELKRNFDIDIYDYQFDFQKKHIKIKKDNINFLLLRLEDLNESEHIIANFIGDDSYKTINDNIGNKKWYSNTYIEFKNKFKPSQEILEHYLSSKFTKHFYTSEEIEQLREKYSKK